MGPQDKLAAAVAEQVASNRSGIGQADSFAEHRARLTQEILARAPAGGSGRLCLLGAGNANDVDLPALAARFAHIHLVDIDAEAVERTLARVPAPEQSRLTASAPFDASGVFDQLEGWSRKPPRPEDLRDLVPATAARVLAALPAPFDVVVSCCLLTQLQLVLLQVVGDHNPRFEGLRTAVNHIHVRILAGALAPGGVALLVTDVTSNDIYPPLSFVAPDVELTSLMGDLLHAGHVIHAAHPGLLSSDIRRDHELKQDYAVHFPVGPWLWHNGTAQTYLVYGLEITRRVS